jgi:predicted NUDIX family phosphoesterase
MKKGDPLTPEKVLAIPTSCLWGRITYTEKGLITEGIDQITALAANCGVFMDRPEAEADPGHKQVIPYAVIRHSERYFLLQRKRTQSE